MYTWTLIETAPMYMPYIECLGIGVITHHDRMSHLHFRRLFLWPKGGLSPEACPHSIHGIVHGPMDGPGTVPWVFHDGQCNITNIFHDSSIPNHPNAWTIDLHVIPRVSHSCQPFSRHISSDPPVPRPSKRSCRTSLKGAPPSTIREPSCRIKPHDTPSRAPTRRAAKHHAPPRRARSVPTVLFEVSTEWPRSRFNQVGLYILYRFPRCFNSLVSVDSLADTRKHGRPWSPNRMFSRHFRLHRHLLGPGWSSQRTSDTFSSTVDLSCFQPSRIS